MCFKCKVIMLKRFGTEIVRFGTEIVRFGTVYRERERERLLMCVCVCCACMLLDKVKLVRDPIQCMHVFLLKHAQKIVMSMANKPS